MDWEVIDKERRQKIDEERKRLLAMSDSEAESLPVPDRYQRMRYQREIEAAEWLDGIRRGLKVDQPVKKRYAGKPTKVLFTSD